MAAARTDIAEPGGQPTSAGKKPGTDWTTDNQRRRTANKGSRRAAQLADPRTAEEQAAAQAVLALPRIIIGDGSAET